MQGLTKKHAEALRAIKNFILDEGYSPTYADLGKRLGITRQAVAYRVAELKKRGAITFTPGRAGSIVVLDAQ